VLFTLVLILLEVVIASPSTMDPQRQHKSAASALLQQFNLRAP